MGGFNQKVIDRWSPMVDNHIVIRNNYFRYLTCHYFEYLSRTSLDISEEVLNFKDKISNLPEFKKEIKKEYINILTGRKEFLLENGYIFDPTSIDFYLTTDQLVGIFGIDFITSLEPILAREFKINKIIGDEN